jgi:integrase/recombinase XerD
MDPEAIARVIRKYAAALGVNRGYSARTLYASPSSPQPSKTARKLEDLQKAAGNRDPSTTKL